MAGEEYLLICCLLLCVEYLYSEEAFLPIPSVWQVQQFIRS